MIAGCDIEAFRPMQGQMTEAPEKGIVQKNPSAEELQVAFFTELCFFWPRTAYGLWVAGGALIHPRAPYIGAG